MLGKQILPGRSQLLSASSSTTFYHDVAAGKHCHSTQFAVLMGWHCFFSPEPPAWVFCRSARLAHSTSLSLHSSHVSLLLEQWMLTQSPQPACTTLPHEHLTKVTCKTPSETSDTPLPPAYYNQCRKTNACIYVVFVLQAIAHSKRCSLGCREGH